MGESEYLFAVVKCVVGLRAERIKQMMSSEHRGAYTKVKARSNTVDDNQQ